MVVARIIYIKQAMIKRTAFLKICIFTFKIDDDSKFVSSLLQNDNDWSSFEASRAYTITFYLKS